MIRIARNLVSQIYAVGEERYTTKNERILTGLLCPHLLPVIMVIFCLQKRQNYEIRFVAPHWIKMLRAVLTRDVSFVCVSHRLIIVNYSTKGEATGRHNRLAE